MEGNWFFDKKKAVTGASSILGIHKIDLMQYLTGQTVIETTARFLTLNKHCRITSSAWTQTPCASCG